MQAVAHKIIEIIYSEASVCCETPAVGLTPLAEFIARLRKDYITRIYTTNYDDFLLQAVPDLYTGFDPAWASPKPFGLETFWRKENEASLFHLHGSVHMGFPSQFRQALRSVSYSGSTKGTKPVRTQRSEAAASGVWTAPAFCARPSSPVSISSPDFSSARSRIFTRRSHGTRCYADVIYVIGSGLADLHLNTWLHEARTRSPRTPILFIDWWKERI